MLGADTVKKEAREKRGQQQNNCTSMPPERGESMQEDGEGEKRKKSL